VPTPALPDVVELLVALGYLADDGASLGTLAPAEALELASRLTSATASTLRP
jgi:hypothetical protein